MPWQCPSTAVVPAKAQQRRVMAWAALIVEVLAFALLCYALPCMVMPLLTVEIIVANRQPPIRASLHRRIASCRLLQHPTLHCSALIPRLVSIASHHWRAASTCPSSPCHTGGDGRVEKGVVGGWGTSEVDCYCPLKVDERTGHVIHRPLPASAVQRVIFSKLLHASTKWP